MSRLFRQLILGCAFSLLFGLLSWADTCAPRDGEFVSYVVRAGESTYFSLNVLLTFRLRNRSEIDLLLPSEWQGAKNLYEHVHNLHALSPGTSILDSSDRSRKHLSFERGKTVQLEYSFRQDGTTSGDSYFSPVLNSNFFVLTGRNFIVRPDLPEHEILPVSLQWESFPKEWTLVDSMGIGDSCHHADNMLSISNGLYVGGDFRLREETVSGFPVVVAIRGNWSFTDERFAETAAKILAAERDFWNDHRVRHYLIAAIPIDAPAGEYAGTAVENGFLTLMAPETELGVDLEFLLAHEMFHSWNPAQLGEVSAESPVYWFAEGFTDYYAYQFLARTSLITSQQYVDEVNKTLAEYSTSAVKNLDEHAVEAGYFANPAVQRLPYLQGSLLALKWNALIRKRSASKMSLDDAMRFLRQKAQHSQQSLSDQSLGKYFESLGGPDVIHDIQSHVVSGETLTPDADALGSCYQLDQKELYTFEAGFDVESTYREGRMRGVKPNSAAFKAGLRDGQIIMRSGAIDPNDPEHEIVMTVLDHGRPSTIQYLPHGNSLEVDQYELKPQFHEQCPGIATP